MPVSPLMDRRQKGGITRSQIGFFSIVGIPLFRTLADVFEATNPLLTGVMANYKVGVLLALLLSMTFERCCSTMSPWVLYWPLALHPCQMPGCSGWSWQTHADVTLA